MSSLYSRVGRDGLSRPFPKRRFDAQLIDGLNDAAQVMSQHFAQGFVDLSRSRFAAEPVAKLRLDHAES